MRCLAICMSRDARAPSRRTPRGGKWGAAKVEGDRPQRAMGVSVGPNAGKRPPIAWKGIEMPSLRPWFGALCPRYLRSFARCSPLGACSPLRNRWASSSTSSSREPTLPMGVSRASLKR